MVPEIFFFLVPNMGWFLTNFLIILFTSISLFFFLIACFFWAITLGSDPDSSQYTLSEFGEMSSSSKLEVISLGDDMGCQGTSTVFVKESEM